MTDKSKGTDTKKILNMITTGIAVIIGLLILGLLFFKFMPGYNFYVVRSGSMVPAIGVGNIVFTGPAGSIAPGTIITFQKDGETVTHRVYSIEDGNITTKGDANKTPDAGTITLSDVKGVYLFQAPGLGYLTNLVSTKQGWFMIIIVPSAILVLLLVKDILKEAFKDDKKKAAAASGKKVAQASVPVGRNQRENPLQAPINNIVAEPGAPSAAINVSSETAYQNISRPEIASSVPAERKAPKRPFYSFLLFDDESQKASATASTAAYMEAPAISQAASHAEVIGYPAQQVQKPVASTGGGSMPVNNPEAVSALSWLEFVRQPIVPVTNAAAARPISAIPADSVYIKREPSTPPAVANKKSQFNTGCVFSNKEVNDKVKDELKRLLNNYN